MAYERDLALAALVGCLALWGGCKGSGDEAPSEAPAARSGAAATARPPAELLEKVAGRLPAASRFVLVVDLKSVMGDMTDISLGLLPKPSDPTAVQADLSKVYRRFLGLDPMKAEYAVGFGDPAAGMAGVFVAGPFEEVSLAGAEKIEIAGKQATVIEEGVAVLVVDGGLVLGTPPAIEQLLGSGPKLAGTPLVEAHLSALKRLGAAPWAASGDVTGLVDQISAGSPLEGISATHVAATLGGLEGTAAISVIADQASRDRLKSLIDMGMAAARGFIAEHSGKVETGETLEEALLGVAVRHLGPAALDLPKVDDDGEALTVRLTLPGDQRYAFVVGILAAVAIPAFQKYLDRSRSAGRCAKAFEHTVEIMRKELGDTGADAMAKSRDHFFDSCRKASPKVIDCILAAEDVASLSKCELR